MLEFLKKYKFETAAILVILVVAIFFISDFLRPHSMPQTPTPLTPPPGASPSPTPQQKASPLPPSPQPTSTLKIAGLPLPGKTYQEVVETYKDRRVQFDGICKATPNRLTFKNGPEIMFDNRTGSDKVIKLDKVGYKIGPYGFVVLSITSLSLPYIVSIDCNELFNVAAISLQQ